MAAPPSTRLLQACILVVGLGLGAAVELVAGGSGWPLDLAVGAAFVVLAVLSVGRSRATAVLASAVAVAWWLGTLMPEPAIFWHRGPLIHLLLAAPLAAAAGRPRVRWLVVPVGVGYAASLIPATWLQPWAAAALAAGWAAVAIVASRDRSPTSLRGWVLAGNIVVAATIAAGALISTLIPAARAAQPMLITYEIVLIAVAATFALLLRAADPRRVADRVVALDESTSGDLTRALAATLGDPSLVVGYWDAERSEYRTPRGEVVGAGAPGRRTLIPRAGEPFVLLVHEVPLDGDPQLLRAVQDAVLVAATNSELRARSEAAVAEVRRSELRLAAAENDERREVGDVLRTTVLTPLKELDVEWHDAPAADRPDLRRAREMLSRAMLTLERAVDGLNLTDDADGLSDAVTQLADRLGVTAIIDIPPLELPADIAHALYHVTAEGLTNIAKHAPRARARIALSRDRDTATLVIADDGEGGADVGAGSGLAGIESRVASLDGRMQLTSSPGEGTRMTVVVPLSR